MQPRQLPNLQDAAKIDWDDWKKWEWMQPGWKGIKMHSQCVINADSSAELSALITHCECILMPFQPGCIHSHFFQSSQSIFAASCKFGNCRGCMRGGKSLVGTL